MAGLVSRPERELGSAATHTLQPGQQDRNGAKKYIDSHTAVPKVVVVSELNGQEQQPLTP
jgi:hypothetical protein